MIWRSNSDFKEGMILMMKEEQIIESARFFFNKYGYKRVSMDEIAKSAGVTSSCDLCPFDSKN